MRLLSRHRAVQAEAHQKENVNLVMSASDASLKIIASVRYLGVLLQENGNELSIQHLCKNLCVHYYRI